MLVIFKGSYMKKDITCDKCHGTGRIEVNICDECGEETNTGDYEGKQICPNCWAAKLTGEEINNL